MPIEIKIIANSPEELTLWAAHFAGLKPEETIAKETARIVSAAVERSSAPKEEDKKAETPPAAETKPEETPVDLEAAKARKAADTQFKELGKIDKDACKAILKTLGAKKVSEVQDSQMAEFVELMAPYFVEPAESAEDVIAEESESKEAESESEEPKHTIEELRKLAVSVTSGNAKKKEAMRKILSDVGAASVGSVDKAKIDEVYEKLTQLED